MKTTLLPLDLKVNGLDDPVGAVVTLDNMCPCQFKEVAVKLTNDGSQDGIADIHYVNVVDSEPTEDTEPEADAEYAPPEYYTPTIDGQLDEGYRLVVTDEETEAGYLPIKIYVACDDEYMYWFFEATDPTTLEQGIGNTNLLFDTDGDGVWGEGDEIVYLQEVVYDKDFVEVPDSKLARDISGSPEIGYTLEVAIPRSDERYACHPWVYDVCSLGSPARNTAWGDTSYWTLLYPTELPEGNPIMVVPWLDCPCAPVPTDIFDISNWILVDIWYDENGNGVWDSGEFIIRESEGWTLRGIECHDWNLGLLPAGASRYVYLSFHLKAETGNAYQGDRATFDIEFTLEQA